MRVIASAISCLVLASCATVETLPDRAYAGDPAVAVNGVSYALPVLQYSLKIDRTLTACPQYAGGTINPPAFDLAVEASGEYVAGETYLVDYEKLGGPLKTSSFTLDKYPNGTLKSIGASADDQTGKVALAVAKIAASVVMLSAGVPVMMVPSPNKNVAAIKLFDVEGSAAPRILDCKDSTKTALATHKARKATLEAASKTVNQANDAVERLAREIALEVTDPEAAETRTRWKDAIEHQDIAVAAAKTVQKKVDDARKLLTVTETIFWPQSVQESYSSELGARVEASPETANKFLELFEERDLAQEEGAFTDRLKADSATNCHIVSQGMLAAKDGALASCINSALPIYVEAKPVGIATHECVPAAEAFGCREKVVTDGRARATDLQADGGIFYRDPMWAVLWVCQASAVPEGEASCPETVEIKNLTPVNFSQFGRLRFLPFRVPIFKQKDMKLDLDASGRMTYFHMKSTKAALAEAADTAQQIAAVAAETSEEYETERRSDREYSLTAATAAKKAEIDGIETDKKLAVLTTPTAPVVPGSAADLTARTAELDLQIAFKKAELTEALLLAVNANDTAAVAQILAMLK